MGMDPVITGIIITVTGGVIVALITKLITFIQLKVKIKKLERANDVLNKELEKVKLENTNLRHEIESAHIILLPGKHTGLDDGGL